jgi:hypothetical protein
MYEYIYVFIYICVYTLTYINVTINIHIYIYIYIYIYNLHIIGQSLLQRNGHYKKILDLAVDRYYLVGGSY